ncbi:hypothetical protein [Actinomadura sp. SCN-SB]|uniref:hypothetical protein n=1 Tax=Actinomadura sp. SCN-SB TaxID=3373092 RepID=UPI003753E55F
MSFDHHDRRDRRSHRRLGRAAAEDLLAGVWRDPEVAAHPVAGVLAAAAAPARGDELGGEDAAVAAFRQARLTAGHRPGRGRTVRRALLKIATAKAIAALVLGATAAGGAALATGTGNLPALERLSPSRPSASATSSTTASGPGQPRRTPSPMTPERGAPVPSSQAELCRTFLAPGKPGRHVSDPAFAPLIAAAGTPGKVKSYCAKLLNREDQGKKPGDPSQKGPEGSKKDKKPGKEKKPKPGKPEKPGQGPKE